VSLAFDPERAVDEQGCAACPGPCRLVRGYLTWFGEPTAAFFAACHDHDGERDVLIDVILGWASEADRDRVTFGCRVGPIEGHNGPVATLVDAAARYAPAPDWGRKLSRSAALNDHRLQTFWDAVDFILVHDPTVRPHVYDTN
jgi:hypothetical protein